MLCPTRRAGVGHERGRPGGGAEWWDGGVASGAVTAVVDWVEKGKAPDTLLASKVTAGAVVRTRPLCPYPQVARYKGQGSIDEAANFSCVAPPGRWSSIRLKPNSTNM